MRGRLWTGWFGRNGALGKAQPDWVSPVLKWRVVRHGLAGEEWLVWARLVRFCREWFGQELQEWLATDS